MNLLKYRKHRTNRVVRWRPQIPARRRPRRFPRSLTAAGGVTALAVGGVMAAILLGSVIMLGVGALAAGMVIIGGYWFRAKRNGLWVHVLVDTDDVVISLALPIPLALIRWGLRTSPVSDDAVEMARLILEDQELQEALHEDAIEITLDNGSEHVEVIIGQRRKHWRAFQFNLARSFSQTQPLSKLEETTHV